MAKQILTIASWVAGQSQDDKIGSRDSFAYSRHLDFRKSPSKLTVLPKTTKDSGTTVTDLITAGIQLPSGKKVFIDTAGGVYIRSIAGAWSKLAGSLGTTGCGMVYNSIHDTIYVPNQHNISTITGADGVYGGSPTISANTFVANLDQSGGSIASTYTTTSVISETAANKLTFTPTVDPLYSVKIYVTTKGTASLTVTIHDNANNTLGSSTVTAAALNNGALNEFVFTTPVRVRAAPNPSTYHMHVTHGTGTASTIGTGTVNDFSTAQFETYGSRLVNPVNGFHPVVEFQQFYCIANGNYLAVWEPISQSAPSNSEWQRHRLTFPSGYEATSMAIYSDYLAIACEKKSSSAVNEFQDGKIFFWDGSSPTFNFIVDVPEGAPYAIYSKQNKLHWWAAHKLWSWGGDNPEAIQQVANTDTEYTSGNTYTIVYPNMVTTRRGILLAGYPSETNNTALEHGIYSFGTRSRIYPESFGYSYTMSTGSRLNTGSNNLRIGMIKNFGDVLYVAWRDGSTYGVDVVDNSSTPFTSGEWQALWFDNFRTDKRKGSPKLLIDFEALPTGSTITPKYRLARGAAFTTGQVFGVGKTQAVMDIDNSFEDIQVGFDYTCGATSPQIIGLSLIFEDNVSEED